MRFTRRLNAAIITAGAAVLVVAMPDVANAEGYYPYRITSSGADSTCTVWSENWNTVPDFKIHMECDITDTSRDGMSAKVQYQLDGWSTKEVSNSSGKGTTVHRSVVTWGDTAARTFKWRSCRGLGLNCSSWLVYNFDGRF
jgi:hypothetical protein